MMRLKNGTHKHVKLVPPTPSLNLRHPLSQADRNPLPIIPHEGADGIKNAKKVDHSLQIQSRNIHAMIVIRIGMGITILRCNPMSRTLKKFERCVYWKKIVCWLISPPPKMPSYPCSSARQQLSHSCLKFPSPVRWYRPWNAVALSHC